MNASARKSAHDVRYNGRWLYAGPPHSGGSVVTDGRCECEDCDLYYRWEDVAEALTQSAEESANLWADTHCSTCGNFFVWHGRDENARSCPECRLVEEG